MSEIIVFLSEQWLLTGLLITFVFVLILTEMSKRAAALGSAAATRLMNHENALVLDLRPASDYAQGHIAGAMSLNPAEAASTLKRKKVPAARPLLLVCADGGTVSRSLSGELQKAGCDKVLVLAGGIRNWRLDGMPVVTGRDTSSKSVGKKARLGAKK